MHSHDREFFRAFNPLSTYWAGFIAADGCVSASDDSVRIGLAEKDLAQLEQFCRDTKYTGIPRYRPKTKSYTVAIYGAREWSYDLENGYNIVPRKSLILKPPVELELCGAEREYLTKCFIKGYIDGDGHIRLTSRDELWLLDVFSGSDDLVRWVRQQFELIYGVPRKSLYRYGSGTTYRLIGRHALPILQDLKSVSPRGLHRKWDKIPDGAGIIDFSSASEIKKRSILRFVEETGRRPSSDSDDGVEARLATTLCHYLASTDRCYDTAFEREYYSLLVAKGARRIRASVRKRLFGEESVRGYE